MKSFLVKVSIDNGRYVWSNNRFESIDASNLPTAAQRATKQGIKNFRKAGHKERVKKVYLEIQNN